MRSMRETLSDIYYRIYYLLCNNVGRASIAGKITVQVNASATRAFWWGGRVVGFVGLTKPNYKPTTGGKRIGTPKEKALLLKIQRGNS
jgi:hypothetical protein